MQLKYNKYKPAGGIHPKYAKELSEDKAIESVPVPKSLFIPLAQHIGAPAKCLVNKGDIVVRGQVLGEAAGFISACIHASTSGKIKNIQKMLSLRGSMVETIELTVDDQNNQESLLEPIKEWQQKDKAVLLKRVAEAGIVGMGGAGFPTNVKLSPPPDKHIDTLIVNGAECEPYITADYRVMLEMTEQVWSGIKIIRKILDAENVYIAIEDNKPKALEAIGKAVKDSAEVVKVRTMYPQGAEKQLIYSITGRKVPTGALPMDVGVVVQNVGTCLAVRNAVIQGEALTERVVTVSGEGINEPKNLKVKIGTLVSDLIEYCGGFKGTPGKLIMGGPMMGLAQASAEVSVTKTTSSVLVLEKSQVKQFASLPCIGCGRCVEACPMGLEPCTISELVEAENYEEAEKYNIADCIECGSCAYECVSQRPLVQMIQYGKSEVASIRHKRETDNKDKK
jgi:Na+-translocating ferredoxin:NAD+ oxidoreductase subunit C